MPRQYWTIWYPNAASTGLLLARSLVESTDALLLHAAPDVISVEVSNERGQALAKGQDLERTQTSPMCRLIIKDSRVEREDVWPGEFDIGASVILPGGEAGILKAWWNADDKKEWRWEVEFYNTIR